MSASAPDWVNLIVEEDDPAVAWNRICTTLHDVAMQSSKSGALDKATVVPDRLLANSAWNLWDEFLHHVPTVINELKQFWVQTTATGTAVLILDALSLRELPIIIAAANDRGLKPTRTQACGAQVPTETDRFAEALGLSGRSKLSHNQPPSTFIFAGEDVHTEVLNGSFADCITGIPSKPRLFVWHEWPDETIHLHAKKEEGPDIVANQTRQLLSSDDFWRFVERMRQGRRLVITSDHGYAASRFFSDEVKDADAIQQLKNAFGAERCAKESPTSPWPRRHLPPLVSRYNGWLAVLGQRKWTVQGGFPHLCHGGLSLLEAIVPFIEFPAK